MISAIVSRSCGESVVTLGKSTALAADGPKCDDDKVVAVAVVVVVDNNAHNSCLIFFLQRVGLRSDGMCDSLPRPKKRALRPQETS